VLLPGTIVLIVVRAKAGSSPLKRLLNDKMVDLAGLRARFLGQLVKARPFGMAIHEVTTTSLEMTMGGDSVRLQS
jgi:hypothetical protein